ncbi:MAG: hypothetical protein KC491_00215 [Dehalococcoidia bacterium]|nr:hypothetical protein [Dehalococcoidia bacterium]
MRLLCLDFPTLPIALVRRAHPHLSERPIVLLAGPGADAPVTAASPAAITRGVIPGMPAVAARGRCASAMFLPENPGACVDELERIASIIAKYATLSVAITSQTRIMIDVTTVNDEVRMGERLASLARQWTGLEVRAGVGSSRSQAEDAATLVRRGVAIDTRPAGEDEPPPQAMQPLTGRVTLRGEPDDDQRRLRGLIARLARLQDSLGQACREVTLRMVADDLVMRRRLRFDRPTGVLEAQDRIEAAVSTVPVEGPVVLELELGRPAPLLLATRYREALATAV